MNQKDSVIYILMAVALTVGLLVVANAVGIWRIPELWSQILAACMGAIVVGVVTLVLMRGQKSSEEAKEKSIRIYESKVEVYSRFVGKMYKLLADDRMSCDDFLSLRTEMFGSLIFYLSDENLNSLLAELNGITSIHNNEEMVSVFARITNILQDDLAGRQHRPDDKERVLTDIWHQFGNLTQCSHH